jgi:acetylcholinesterase
MHKIITITLTSACRYSETQNNVYVYYFTERASNNPWPGWSGVLHADEVAILSVSVF